jgi:nicotinamidase-related amidase
MLDVALILVDFQKDYLPGGALPLVGMDYAIARAAELLATFRQCNAKVIHVHHENPTDGPFLCKNSPGVECCTSLEEIENELVVVKSFPNAFRGTTLKETLDKWEVKTVIICGAMSNMCVEATARAAFDLELKCIVVHDACATTNVEFHGVGVSAQKVHVASMATLAAVYSRVLSAAETIAELKCKLEPANG